MHCSRHVDKTLNANEKLGIGHVVYDGLVVVEQQLLDHCGVL